MARSTEEAAEQVCGAERCCAPKKNAGEPTRACGQGGAGGAGAGVRHAGQRGSGMHGRRPPGTSHKPKQAQHAGRETRTHAADATTACSGTGRPLQSKGTRASCPPGKGCNGWGGAHLPELTARSRKLVIAAWCSAYVVGFVAMASAHRQMKGRWAGSVLASERSGNGRAALRRWSVHRRACVERATRRQGGENAARLS